MQEWSYSRERLKVRDEVLLKLLHRFGPHHNEDGTPTYSNESLYNCAQDWTSMGKRHVEGVIDFYLENYA